MMVLFTPVTLCSCRFILFTPTNEALQMDRMDPERSARRFVKMESECLRPTHRLTKSECLRQDGLFWYFKILFLCIFHNRFIWDSQYYTSLPSGPVVCGIPDLAWTAISLQYVGFGGCILTPCDLSVGFTCNSPEMSSLFVLDTVRFHFLRDIQI
jgi:hypothetical protein